VKIPKDLIRITGEIEGEGRTSVKSTGSLPWPVASVVLQRMEPVGAPADLTGLHIPVLLLVAAGVHLGGRRQQSYGTDSIRLLLLERCPEDNRWGHLAKATSNPVILLYHGVGAPGKPPSRYVLPAVRFARQMAWLRLWRYNILSLEDFLNDRRSHRLPPPRSVILTFDDGYEDNYLHAYPILKNYGFPATIFLVSRAIGGTNQWDTGSDLTGRPILSLPQIREMQAGGLSFGAHTRSHRKLTELPAEQVIDEIQGSRSDLEQQLDRPVLTFSFPYGRYNRVSQRTAEQAGFLGACSVESGLNDPDIPSYALRRAGFMEQTRCSFLFLPSGLGIRVCLRIYS
jgi:peptidoglycan/xylan/chitin deacetylase (PgdA/CDA1 family)